MARRFLAYTSCVEGELELLGDACFGNSFGGGFGDGFACCFGGGLDCCFD